MHAYMSYRAYMHVMMCLKMCGGKSPLTHSQASVRVWSTSCSAALLLSASSVVIMSRREERAHRGGAHWNWGVFRLCSEPDWWSRKTVRHDWQTGCGGDTHCNCIPQVYSVKAHRHTRVMYDASMEERSSTDAVYITESEEARLVRWRGDVLGAAWLPVWLINTTAVIAAITVGFTNMLKVNRISVYHS